MHQAFLSAKCTKTHFEESLRQTFAKEHNVRFHQTFFADLAPRRIWGLGHEALSFFSSQQSERQEGMKKGKRNISNGENKGKTRSCFEQESANRIRC
jgi:hypothetical protein